MARGWTWLPTLGSALGKRTETGKEDGPRTRPDCEAAREYCGTALMSSFSQGPELIVKLLLDHGVDVSALN